MTRKKREGNPYVDADTEGSGIVSIVLYSRAKMFSCEAPLDLDVGAGRVKSTEKKQGVVPSEQIWKRICPTPTHGK